MIKNTREAVVYTAVVIGCSAGGSAALAQILPALPAGYALPLIIVQHLHPYQAGPALVYSCQGCNLVIKEAEDKEPIRPGAAYFAPANYHLLVEDQCVFSLSVDEKVNYTRPSFDVLFESASDVYGAGLIGVILSGANNDGAAGLCAVKARGGLAIVQDPGSAEASFMPQAALAVAAVDHVLSPVEIGKFLSGVSDHAEEA